MAWTLNDAAYLARRTGLGANTQEVNNLFALGRDAAIDYLINYSAIPDPAWDAVNPLALPDPTKDNWQAVLTLIYRFLSSSRPLQTRLTWFWHGHFTSSVQAAGGLLMSRQMKTWRDYASGSFRDFLVAMYKDGAMLRFLNGDPSTKEGPNENFARENMELFTTGTGPYKEKDVRECARAFTGWEVGYPDPKVTFNPDAHDADLKTILGQTGHFNGDDVMRILFERPETRKRICSKLFRYFVSETLSYSALDLMMKAWVRTDGNLKAVLETMFKAPDFWYPGVRGTLVKGSMEYAAGLARRLEHRINKDLVENIAWRLPQMGQAPFEPPNPAGYATGLRLSGASMLIARYQYAWYVIYDIDQPRVVNRMTLGLPANPSPDAFVTFMVQKLGSTTLSTTTRKAILDYLGAGTISTATLKEKTLGTLYLLACSPEYQMS